MSAITIVGGVYHEQCIWPDWDQLYGSGGRAAAALAGRVSTVTLRTYARADTAELFRKYAEMYGFVLSAEPSGQTISFEYVHCLSTPIIRPVAALIQINPDLNISGEAVLCFGMMEGAAKVNADWCVYDPQSPLAPKLFAENGSQAKHLAVVANRLEVSRLVGEERLEAAARALMQQGAEVVVVKSGTEGAFVFDASGMSIVPPFRTARAWTIGSGDVFAAIFAQEWAIEKCPPAEAALLASRAVAEYVDTMALPIPSAAALKDAPLPAATAIPGKVYLAGPFFSIGQRWLVDEARRCLKDLGMDVFSPVHDVGHGLADEVAPADVAALDECDVVFAILDGLDSGTFFEVGYARARNKPVYGLAQTASEEDLKMLSGTNCKIYNDFATALHHLVWRV